MYHVLHQRDIYVVRFVITYRIIVSTHQLVMSLQCFRTLPLQNVHNDTLHFGSKVLCSIYLIFLNVCTTLLMQFAGLTLEGAYS